jgi:hypothetical protein
VYRSKRQQRQIQNFWKSIGVAGVIFLVSIASMWVIDHQTRPNIHAHSINWTTGQGLTCVQTQIYKNLGTRENPQPSLKPITQRLGDQNGFINLRLADGSYLIQVDCPNDSPLVAQSWFVIRDGKLSETQCDAIVGSENITPIDIPLGMLDPTTGQILPQKYFMPSECLKPNAPPIIQ